MANKTFADIADATTVDPANTTLIWNGSANKETTVKNFIKAYGSATELTSVDTGNDKIPVIDATDGDLKWVKPSNLGGSGLTNSVAAVTTTNVTGVPGTRHVLDISGMTADRNFVLPAGTAGQEIEVFISVGDATYELGIIGDTGITLTGLGVTTAAATKITDLFITGESLKFIATSATNWAVMDRRIKQVGIIERQTAQSINNTTDTKIQFATNIKNVGDVTDVATNYRITVRRAGTYNIQGYASLAAALDDNESVEVYIYVSGALVKVGNSYTANAGGARQGFITIFATLDLAAGAYIELNVWHNEGAAVNTNTTYYPQLAVVEVF